MKFWNKRTFLSYLLWPFSILFLMIARIRAFLYQQGYLKAYKAPVPVIIIGNITVGGTGKTPLLICLAEHLSKVGYKVGIVSRGYKSKINTYPWLVTEADTAEQVGDEPLLIHRKTGLPVCIDPQRTRAVKFLLDHYPLHIILSDDGLQHYALTRDVEIAVQSAQNPWGNGFLLPAGPLREPVSRLKKVDYLINNGNLDSENLSMRIVLDKVYALQDKTRELDLKQFAHKRVHAVAGIAKPEKFFNFLKEYQLDIIEHAFSDHYAFKENELVFDDSLPIFITEKDAVKCQAFKHSNIWVVAIKTELPELFIKSFLQKVEGLYAKM